MTTDLKPEDSTALEEAAARIDRRDRFLEAIISEPYTDPNDLRAPIDIFAPFKGPR